MSEHPPRVTTAEALAICAAQKELLEVSDRFEEALRTQLAAMTAKRDELQTSMDELRNACAEIIGADPQTWPDHGNVPLAIAACLGLRDADLQKTTAERDAALAKVAALREALVESVDQMIGDAMSIEWECGDCRMLEKMEADHDLSPAIYLARNALEQTR